MLLQIALFHYFMVEYYSIVCIHIYIYIFKSIAVYMYIPHLLFCSSVNGHVDCFHVLAIVSSAAMNIVRHVSF